MRHDGTLGTSDHSSASPPHGRTGRSWPTLGRGGTSVAGRRASWTYLLAGGVAVACYLVVPPLVGETWLFELVGLSTAVVIAIGVTRYRPRPALPWLLFIVAQVLFVAGDFFYYTYDLSFPSLADGLYIAYYPIQAAGLLLLVRSRTPGRDWASLLDAAIFAIGFGLLSWVYLIEPYTRQAEESQVSRLVSMAYPAMDVLLLGVAARLVMGNGARPRAFHLLAASTLCLILTDVAYGTIELNGSYNVGSALDVGWMCTYLLWGAAALDPSMRELSTRASATDTSLSGRRVLLLAAATLVAPATLLVNSWWPVDGFDVPVAAAASAVLFGLVLVRMLGLVSSLRDAVQRHQRAERRETVLRGAATALTAAPDREYIRRAAYEGARDLVKGMAHVEIVVDIRDGHVPAQVVTIASPGALVVPLSTQAAIYGRLVLISAVPVPTDVVDGLRTLGAQVALALEGVALTEDLSRHRSEARVGALVRNSTDVIMVLDAALVIRFVTPSVSHVLGHRPEDLVGTRLPSLVDPDEQAALTRFSLANRLHERARTEWRMRRGDGRYTDVEVVGTDLLENPSVNGIVVTARDVTERKALEVGLKRQVQELEELDRIRSEFVATVSHELRTPLTSIIGEVELLVDGDLGELAAAQARGVEVIGRNGQRLLTLIDDLLMLSHIETSALELRREPTPVARLVDGLRCQVEHTAAAKPVELAIDCCPGVGSVHVDREQLGRALLNLLTNAVKFTPAGGRVVLDARRDGEDLVITVSDTGVGIPLDEQDRLFTRFFRSSVATRMAIQGTGLGLAIVKQIVEEHGGTVGIVSTPDVGTTVTVTIPAGEEPDARSDVA
jgi:PAS domain S-box-containing protein